MKCPITPPHIPNLPDNVVLAIAGSTVGGALLLVVTIGALLCALIMKLKRHSAADKSQSKLHDQLFIQHEVGNTSISVHFYVFYQPDHVYFSFYTLKQLP